MLPCSYNIHYPLVKFLPSFSEMTLQFRYFAETLCSSGKENLRLSCEAYKTKTPLQPTAHFSPLLGCRQSNRRTRAGLERGAAPEIAWLNLTEHCTHHCFTEHSVHSGLSRLHESRTMEPLKDRELDFGAKSKRIGDRMTAFPTEGSNEQPSSAAMFLFLEHSPKGM